MVGFLKKFLAKILKKFLIKHKAASIPNGKRSALTKQVEPKQVSERHVGVVISGQMSMQGKEHETDKNTGPWYIGKTIADIFEIRGVLGRGGMGIVYLASQVTTQRKFAIKVALGKFVEDKFLRQCFTREAEAWTQLVHPHIVHAFFVLDDQSTDYRPAIFMDYCDGSNLAQRLESDLQLSIADKLDIAIQVCWGMEFAHKQGYVHRDLKPSNVLLTSAGKAMVSDFGLVKQLGLGDLEVKADDLKQQDNRLYTSLAHGLVFGTPEYMPPEQWEGKAYKHSDIYSFGIVLYELFCGVRPFVVSTRASLRDWHCRVHPPNPQRNNPQVPDVLARLMLACLAKKPSVRPKDFNEVATQLEIAYREHTGEDHCSRHNKPTDTVVARENRFFQAASLVLQAHGCIMRGQWEAAQRQVTRAADIFQEIDDLTGLADCLSTKAYVFRLHGKLDEAMKLYEEAHHLWEETDNMDGLAGCWINQAAILSLKGKLDLAMKLLEQAEQVCRKTDNDYWIQTALGDRAKIFRQRGELDKAMKLFKQKEIICRKLNYMSALASALADQAVIHQMRNDLDAALRLNMEQEKICRQIVDLNGLQASLGDQAAIYHKRGDFQTAMKLHDEEEQLCHELNNQNGLQMCLGNKGAILLDQKRLNEAMHLLRQQEEICRELETPEGLAQCLTNMALVLGLMGRLSEARSMGEEAHRIAVEHGLTWMAREIERIMGRFGAY